MRFPARFPWRFGGPDHTQDIEHQALLDALAPGWDTSEGTALWIETRAEALLVTMIWSLNRRIANQLTPTRMLDNLVDWETATNLRPSVDDTTKDRRARLAAKLRGIINNALVDLEDAARAAAGTNFVAMVVPAEVDWITYWPGVIPGPPSFEWCSNRATICIHLNKNGLNEAEFRRKRQAVVDALDDMKPAWQTFVVGVGSGTGSSHICNVGIVGQTII